MSQKIIIPKGLINPNETTIIEIPENIQSYGTFIAKPKYEDTLGYCVADFSTPGDETPQEESTSNLPCYPDEGYDVENIDEVSPRFSSKYVDTSELFDSYPEQDTADRCYEFDDKEDPNTKTTQIEYEENILELELQKSTNVPSNGKIFGVGFPTECIRNLEEDIMQMQKNITHMQNSTINKVKRGPYTIPSHMPNDIMNMLDLMDQIELMKIQKSLTEFQSARRKLVHATTNLPTVDELSITLGYLQSNKNN